MGALNGVKVLDLSRVLAGPTCSQILGDLGATVWKIEPLEGEETRAWGPPYGPDGMSSYFRSANRNKVSLAVNLKHPTGARLVRELADMADVVLENFKVGGLDAYELAPQQLLARRPALIIASITGYGQTGPDRHRPGYDAAIQALCGIMSVTGEPDGEPMKVGVAWVDLLTGLYAAIGILAALRHRDVTGQGQHLDLALLDVGLSAMANLGQATLDTGRCPPRQGNAHAQIVPYGGFQAQDGWFVLAVGNDAQYRRLCEAMQRIDLAEPPYDTNPGRVQARVPLLEQWRQEFLSHPREEILRRLGEASVPATPILSLEEAVQHPQVQHRAEPWKGAMQVLGAQLVSPLAHFSGTPAELRMAPPECGTGTAEILKSVLGWTEDEIASAVAEGAIADPTQPRDSMD